jgi:hypothetical protein
VANQKVRRRRAKLQRHEYELVTTNEEGEEVPVERAPTRANGKQGAAPGELVDRRGRAVQKPSLRRTLRRSAIFVPLIVVLAFVLGGNELSTGQKAFQAMFLTAIFVPFSHLMDVFIYRTVMRRQERERGQGPGKR